MNPNDKVKDTRFPTNNTKLAACLFSLGFKIKKVQPFITEIQVDNGGKKVTTIWLEPSLVRPGRDGQPTRARAIDFQSAWDMRDKWEEHNPKHPINDMRKALEKREYIVRQVIPGPEMDLKDIPRAAFRTRELTLASCIAAHDFYIHGRMGREIIFDAEARSVVRDFNAPSGTDNPTQWMKLAILNYERINKRIAQPDNIECISRERIVRHSDGRMEKRILQLPINCPDDVREQFESYYYGN